METVRERFDVIGLERLARCLESTQETGRRPPAIVTFDDGYVDNYEIAFPILKRLGVRAVFFLPTDYVESERVPWWDEISWIVRRATISEFVLPNTNRVFSLKTADQDSLIRKVLNWVKTQPSTEMSAKIEMVREACGGPQFDRTKNGLFVTWEQTREMFNAGMDFGSHTHTHPVLSHLKPSEQQKEFLISKEVLESMLKARVSSVAYPVGSRVAYSRETMQMARAAGYKFGFNYIGDSQRWPISNPFDINRLRIDDTGLQSRLRELVTFPKFAHV